MSLDHSRPSKPFIVLSSSSTRSIISFIFISAYLVLATMSTEAADASENGGGAGGTIASPNVIKPLYHFTSQLFSALNKDANKSENIILSPISIHKALNMVLLGADKDTTTKRELMDTIGYSGMDEAEVQKQHEDYARILTKFQEITRAGLAKMKADSNKSEDDMEMDSSKRPPVLDMFNMMIAKNKGEVNQNYSTNIKKYYHSSIEIVDDKKPETKTKIIDQMNGWAKEAGFDNPIMTEDTMAGEWDAILVSAIRVQAFWFDNFYEMTLPSVFYNGGIEGAPVRGTALQGGSMHGLRYLELIDASRAKFKSLNRRLGAASESYRQLSDLNCQIVQVPLEGGLSFTIIEPLEFSAPGDNKLNKLVNRLFAKQSNGPNNKTVFTRTLELLDGEFGLNGVNHLVIPKFNFEKEITLNAVLQSIGLNRAFDRERAEISSITSNKLYISEVKHQAMIDVNKVGIKAAGVTRIKMVALSSMHYSEPINVEVKRPFMFVIRYEKIPLFVGQLNNL